MKSRFALAGLMLTMTLVAEAQSLSVFRPTRRPTVDVVEKEKPAEVKEEPKKEEVVVTESEQPEENKEEPKKEEPLDPEGLQVEAPEAIGIGLGEEPKVGDKGEPQKGEPVGVASKPNSKDVVNAKCGGDAKCPDRNNKEEAQAAQDQKVCSEHFSKLRFVRQPEAGFQEKWVAKCVASREKRRENGKDGIVNDLKLQKALRTICEAKVEDDHKPSKKESSKEEAKVESKEESKVESKVEGKEESKHELANHKHEKKDHAREKQIRACMKRIAKLDLDKKKEGKEGKDEKNHLKQCTFSLGVSLECPEGSYRFQGDTVAKELNDESRDAIKALEGKKPEIRTALPVSVRK